ncbi:MAG: type I restriction enzyme S subunit [Shewanella sp.]|jgi:type I restriction enzyme S subunit
MSHAINQVIPEGYKQTDIGVIPDDWVVSALNDVCNFGGGTTPPRAQHDRYFVNGTNNWIKTTDLNNSLIDFSEELITELALSEAGLKKHPVGSILVAMYGGFNQIGRTGYITRPSAINQALVAVKPNRKSLHSYYLLSELNYNVDYWKGVASSSRKDPNITSNDVKNYRIALPPIKEQAAIANALSDVDALLSELENLIIKKQAIKTATMQQLLTGKTRLPQFAFYSDINSTEDAVEGKRNNASATIVNAGAYNDCSLASQESGGMDSRRKGTKTSELGEIPEDWDVISIANLTRNIIDYRGRTPKKLGLDWGGGDIVALSAGNVKKGYIDFEEGCYLGSEELYKKWMKNGSVEKDDIVFTMEAPLGNVALIPDTNRYILSQRTILIQLDRELFEPSFVYQLMMSVQFQSLLSDSATGSTAQGIKRARFEQLLLCLPKNIKEQTAIASILSDMDSEIQTLEQRLSKTRQIKQAMMQELLTGKTRLPFDKDTTSEVSV